uniref:Uncharacterized protein n=1 Tax=Cannabis sativa TaxID=3483 RepID=A0A803NW65_CANSA
MPLLNKQQPLGFPIRKRTMSERLKGLKLKNMDLWVLLLIWSGHLLGKRATSERLKGLILEIADLQVHHTQMVRPTTILLEVIQTMHEINLLYGILFTILMTLDHPMTLQRERDLQSNIGEEPRSSVTKVKSTLPELLMASSTNTSHRCMETLRNRSNSLPTCHSKKDYFEGNSQYSTASSSSQSKRLRDDSIIIKDRSPQLPAKPHDQVTTTRPMSINAFHRLGRQKSLHNNINKKQPANTHITTHDVCRAKFDTLAALVKGITTLGILENLWHLSHLLI